MSKLRLTRPTSPENMLPALTQFGDELERRISFGTAVVTWPGGSAVSNALSVNHELGFMPTVVLVTNTNNSGLTAAPLGSTYQPNATALVFQLSAFTIDGQTPLNTATSTFHWLAIL